VPPADPPRVGYTVREFALRYRIGKDKVRNWIATGQLGAVNVAAALGRKPRWVIPPEAVIAFERRRAGGPAAKTQIRRRRVEGTDYYP
jgi:hypothetical protein